MLKSALSLLNRSVFSVIVLAILVSLAVLSQRYALVMDWTASGRNTLSVASSTLLAGMPEHILIRAFSTSNEGRREATRQLVQRYQRAHANVQLQFIDPQREPREAQRLNIATDGELVIEYQGERENVKQLSEVSISSALARLARGGGRWVGVISGRGERDLYGDSREALGEFSQHLESLGYRMRSIDLGEPNGQTNASGVPDNVDLVLILQPSKPWNAQDTAAVKEWIDKGGNLLWLSDAGGATTTDLATLLGVRPESGMLVDPSSRLNNQPSPEFIVVRDYGTHPITAGLQSLSAFPTATSLLWQAPKDWHFTGLAATGLRAWRETGDLSSAVRFDEGADVIGPLDIAIAGARPHPSGQGEQRIVVFGDTDFLSNAYLGIGANRSLGSNAMNWLSDDDKLIDIAVVMAADLNYTPSQIARAIIALGAPIILPLLLFAFGIIRWRMRRGR